MPQVDLKALNQALLSLPAEEIVSTKFVSPYLLEHVIVPLQQNQPVCYGDLDYDQFDDLELRDASGYCDELSRAAYRLEKLAGNIEHVQACPILKRTFC